jgi:hypothetical protein
MGEAMICVLSANAPDPDRRKSAGDMPESHGFADENAFSPRPVSCGEYHHSKVKSRCRLMINGGSGRRIWEGFWDFSAAGPGQSPNPAAVWHPCSGNEAVRPTAVFV